MGCGGFAAQAGPGCSDSLHVHAVLPLAGAADQDRRRDHAGAASGSA
jgi:hypothetical protein